VTVGQFDGYFGEHPQEAGELRAIQQPLVDYKNRCGLQVSSTDALTVLTEV
jgi:hemophore-related protein